jgi:prolyl-tRNA synthetase
MASAEMAKIATPGKMACADVAAFLKVPLEKIVKTIAVVSEKEDGSTTFALLLLRGDHELNEIKASKIPAISPFRFATEAEVLEQLGCKPGFIGPATVHSQKMAIFADRAVSVMSDFVCGANEAGFHLTGVNFGRDLPEPVVADIRNVVAGDPSPDGKGNLEICRGIEVGHIFQLRQKYAEALNCAYLDENGKSQIMEMGCYGIGVSRIVGSAIEQGNDDKGIVLPAAIAPFEVSIVPMGYFKSDAVKAAADQLYVELRNAGIDVILDDRNERPGVMFADMELIGIPHRVVIGERGLKEAQVEYKGRRDAEATMLPQGEIVSILKGKLCAG